MQEPELICPDNYSADIFILSEAQLLSLNVPLVQIFKNICFLCTPQIFIFIQIIPINTEILILPTLFLPESANKLLEIVMNFSHCIVKTNAQNYRRTKSVLVLKILLKTTNIQVKTDAHFFPVTFERSVQDVRQVSCRQEFWWKQDMPACFHIEESCFL